MGYNESLIDRIADGTAVLLGIEDICKRLGISRTTFDRWCRNGGVKTTGVDVGTLLAAGITGKSTQAITSFIDKSENFTDGAITFPQPDIRIGNSPKWELATFKSWLKKNANPEAT